MPVVNDKYARACACVCVNQNVTECYSWKWSPRYFTRATLDKEKGLDCYPRKTVTRVFSYPRLAGV